MQPPAAVRLDISRDAPGGSSPGATHIGAIRAGWVEAKCLGTAASTAAANRAAKGLFMSNTITISEALNTLDELEAAQEAWTEGSYKKSNEELYAILDRCFTLHQQISGMQDGKRKLIKAINQRLTGMGMNPDKIPDLTSKIVRCTFKDTGKRSTSYARVIKFALADKPVNQTMATYIAGKGGIEEVRRTTKPGALTPSEIKAKLVETAEAELVTAEPLIGKLKLVDELQPANDSEFDFCAALVRKNADGTGAIVYGSTTTSIVKTLLAEAAKKLADSKADAEAYDNLDDAAKARIAVVKEAAQQCAA
jgi:hypothetical protein